MHSPSLAYLGLARLTDRFGMWISAHRDRPHSQYRTCSRQLPKHTDVSSPGSLGCEARLLSTYDPPSTSLTLWQSEGPSF
jgi:hypothetical protein